MSKRTINSAKAVKEKTCSGAELAHALAEIQLSKEEADVWNRDLKKARKSLKSPKSKWQ